MSYESELIERACQAIVNYECLGIDTFEADSALFLRNPASPGHYSSNSVCRIRAETSDEIESLLARAEIVYDDIDHIAFNLDPFTPATFEARLQYEPGFKATSGLFLILEGALKATPGEVDLREVLTSEDWREYGKLQTFNWAEYLATLGEADKPLRFDMLAAKRVKSVDERTWLAYLNGVPAAFFSSWPGNNGIGQVEDLFTHADYRHRGLATALIAHCVADARSRGAREVLIACNPTDTPKDMYRAMGFRPLLMTHNYVRVKAPA